MDHKLEAVGKLNDARGAVNRAQEIVNRYWPEGQLAIPMEPAEHLLLVAFNGEDPRDNYLKALEGFSDRADPWLAKQGLAMNKWVIAAASVSGPPNVYNFSSLVRELMDMRAVWFDSRSAWYLWMQSPGITIYGTMGGDVFNQVGCYGGRQPGVSAWDVDGVHCLAYGKPLNSQRTLPPDWVMGAAFMEIGHQFLLPCRQYIGVPLGSNAIMERWWDWPKAVYEEDGYIWDGNTSKHWRRGNERRWLLESGFFKEV